jgi:hypothetical protein
LVYLLKLVYHFTLNPGTIEFERQEKRNKKILILMLSLYIRTKHDAHYYSMKCMCACMSVCVCERETDRQTDRGMGKFLLDIPFYLPYWAGFFSFTCTYEII